MELSDCLHSQIEPTMSAMTSVMVIQVSIFGFKCLDCGKQWDIGDAVESLIKVAQLESSLAEAKAELAGNALMDAEAESFISGQELVPKGTLDELKGWKTTAENNKFIYEKAREEIERLKKELRSERVRMLLGLYKDNRITQKQFSDAMEELGALEAGEDETLNLPTNG